jgi:hypothetical protein
MGYQEISPVLQVREQDFLAYFYLVSRDSFNRLKSRISGIMGDDNKKPENTPEPQSGFPHKKIVYVIIAIAVVILAVVLIAKFGYNVDLLNPASGEMSLVGRQTNAINREPSYLDLNNYGNAVNVSPGDDSQLANIELQQVLQKQQQSIQMISNVSKSVNDTALAEVRKIGG